MADIVYAHVAERESPLKLRVMSERCYELIRVRRADTLRAASARGYADDTRYKIRRDERARRRSEATIRRHVYAIRASYTSYAVVDYLRRVDTSAMLRDVERRRATPPDESDDAIRARHDAR